MSFCSLIEIILENSHVVFSPHKERPSEPFRGFTLLCHLIFKGYNSYFSQDRDPKKGVGMGETISITVHCHRMILQHDE